LKRKACSEDDRMVSLITAAEHIGIFHRFELMRQGGCLILNSLIHRSHMS
jgi:hypothetical protein